MATLPQAIKETTELPHTSPLASRLISFIHIILIHALAHVLSADDMPALTYSIKRKRKRTLGGDSMANHHACSLNESDASSWNGLSS